MKKSLIAFLTFIVFLPVLLHAQYIPGKAVLDSLQKQVPIAKDDTGTVTLYDRIALGLYKINPDDANALDYAVKERDLADKLGFKDGLANAYNNIGLYYSHENRNKEALHNDSLAYKLEIETHDTIGMGISLKQIGMAYENMGQLDKSMENYLKAQKIFSSLGDTDNITATIMNIGSIFIKIERYAEAQNIYDSGLNYCNNTNHKKLAVGLKYSLGIVSKYRNDLKKAVSYLTEAKDLELQTNDSEYLTQIYCALGDVYLMQDNITDALSNYQLVLQHEKEPVYKYYVASADIGIGSIYYKQVKYSEAEDACVKGSSIAREANFPELVENVDTLLINIYSKTKREQQALEIFWKFNSIKDSMQEVERNAKVIETKMQYTADLSHAADSTQAALQDAHAQDKLKVQKTFTYSGAIVVLLLVGFLFLMRRNNKLLAKEKEKVETALTDLKAAQKQLVQSEKMASLGELTAGIAHEIQNPLNFVNNFSEVSYELVGEMVEELDNGNMEDVKAIADDLKHNLEKITHHGKRADAIVKGMLQHSRTSNGNKEPADINAIADEYLRLAYHGVRAKDKSFNATLKTDFDPNMGNVNIIPQDIGRVVLNMITNAFYAVKERKKLNVDGYEPTVSISTKKKGNMVEIRVTDNGTGIPQKVVDKIFQPFFTTKPTGEGTGLGLSLSYDIITKGHGGELKVETTEGEGSTFIVYLPV